MARTRTNTLVVGTSSANKDIALERLRTLEQQLQERGMPVRVEVGEDVADFSFVTCVPTPGKAADAAWAAILRTHVATALADLAVGPMADRWLGRFLLVEAGRARYPLQNSARARVVQIARQMVEAPPPPEPPALTLPSGQAPGAVTPANLARWHVRIARLVLESLAEHPEGLVAEGLIWFRLPSFVKALRRAAAMTIQDLASQRAEQRATDPWRSLWMGPPPRLYEVHVLPSTGGYRLTDRWGAPVVRRGPGETPGETTTEEMVVAHLVRLSPRRIVVHLPERDPVQSATRSAFPGRIHTCHGCPRCAGVRGSAVAPGSTAAPDPASTRTGSPAPVH